MIYGTGLCNEPSSFYVVFSVLVFLSAKQHMNMHQNNVAIK